MKKQKPKIRISLIVIVTILVMILFLCQPPPAPPPPPPKKVIIVLCDFTSSIDIPKTKNNLLNNVNAIFLNISPNTDYYFYTISDGIEGAFINDSTGSTLTDNDIHKFSQYEHIINEKYNAKPANRTCITNTIEAISSQVSYFQQRSKYKKVYLLLLSDMLEACNWKEEFVNLEENRFDQALAAMQKWPKDKKYLTDSAKLKIGIIFSSGRLVYYNELKNFWTKYFETIGFLKVVFLGNDLPQDFFAD